MLISTLETRNPVTTNKPVDVAQWDTAYIVGAYGDMMYKLAASQLNNCSDAYDVVQDVLLKVHVKKPIWTTPEHANAWLIRAVINCCRDYNKNAFSVNAVQLDERYGITDDSPDYALQEALANLPEKYRTTLYLHYYEGYKIKEIADILKIGESGIKKRLVKGREMLKEHLDLE